MPSNDLDGRYETFHLLGSGGYAEVHLGAMKGENGINRRVAIKRLRWPSAADAEHVELFALEAQMLARLSHPNIVSLVDYRLDLKGSPYLVMEYIDGCPLDRCMARGGCPPSIAIYIATEMLRALGYIHRLPTEAGVRGFLHRDISPQNVLLSWDGTVHVSDFGVAKVIDTLGVKTGTFRGKLAYSSPEQVHRDVLDGRSDLFALGIVLWEMLAGKALFQDVVPGDLASRIMHRPPPSLSDEGGIAADLDAVLERLLAPAVADRYTSAEDAISDLLQCRDWPRSGKDELASLLASRFGRAHRPLVTVADSPRSRPTETDEPTRTLDNQGAAEPSSPRRQISPLWLMSIASAAAVLAILYLLFAKLPPGQRPAAAARPPAADLGLTLEPAAPPVDAESPRPDEPLGHQRASEAEATAQAKPRRLHQSPAPRSAPAMLEEEPASEKKGGDATYPESMRFILGED